MNLCLELAVVTTVFAVGNILFGRFEEGAPRWRRLLKLALTVALVLAVSASLGRAWAFALLLAFVPFVAYIHGVWLPKRGIDGWTAEPRGRYYELRGWMLPPPDTARLTPELQDLGEAWDRAWSRKDAAAVDAMMARDFRYVAPEGPVLDREALLGIARSPTYSQTRGVRSEVSVRVLSPESAVLTYRWTGEGTFEGLAFEHDHRCALICAREEGRWRIVQQHCCAVTA